MKIIAKTQNGWLLDMTPTEITSLYEVASYNKNDKHLILPEVGQEINFKSRYDIKDGDILSASQNIFLKKERATS